MNLKTMSLSGLSALLGLTLLAGPALASGGGGGAISPPRPGATDAFAPTKAVRATVLSVDTAKNTVTIKDQKNRELILTLTKKTKFKAEDSAAFGGRKDLTVSDLVANTSVKVMYQEVNKMAVEIKVLKQ